MGCVGSIRKWRGILRAFWLGMGFDGYASNRDRSILPLLVEVLMRAAPSGSAEQGPKPPWRRVREISQNFVLGHFADHRGTATAALGVHGAERSRVTSSRQTTGEVNPDGKQFVQIPYDNAGFGRSSA